MKRLLMEQLNRWRCKKNRKPLLIRGARQVGSADRSIDQIPRCLQRGI